PRLRAHHAAGRVRSDQAHRGLEGLRALRDPLRKAGPVIPLSWMPPLMFCGLVLFMVLGYPVAFSLAALGFSFGAVGIWQGLFDMNFLQAIPLRIFGNVLANELLLAIPFFTFMGTVLEKCG